VTYFLVFGQDDSFAFFLELESSLERIRVFCLLFFKVLDLSLNALLGIILLLS